MIDIHTHLLPGVDDGPRNWEEALDLCRAAAGEGTRIAVVTPHLVDGVYPNTADRVRAIVAELRRRLAAAGIALEVLAGAETDIGSRGLVDPAAAAEVTALGNGRTVLVEVPVSAPASRLGTMIFALASRGLRPLLAHPERIHALQRRPELAAAWREAGALLQVDAESILGLAGRETFRTAASLIRRGLAHALASDAHSCARRPPRLSKAVAVVEEHAGREVAEFLTREGPARILEGRSPGQPPRAPAWRGRR